MFGGYNFHQIPSLSAPFINTADFFLKVLVFLFEGHIKTSVELGKIHILKIEF